MRKNTAQSEKQGNLFIFITGVLWGLIGVFVKELQRSQATAEQISFMRVGFAFLIMAVLCLGRYGLQSFRVSRRTLAICALLGVVCHGVYNICYSYAVMRAGVAVSAVLLDIAPVFALLWSRILFGEKFSKWKLLAVGVNVAGCVLTVTNGRLDVQTFALSGIFFGAGAGICYSLTAVIGKFAIEKTNPFIINMYSFLAAALFLGVRMQIGRRSFSVSARTCVWGFLYALVPTAIAYVFYYQGISKVTENSRVPVIASVEIVVAAILGVAVYREPLGFASGIGIVLVLLSIVLMNRKSGQNVTP